MAQAPTTGMFQWLKYGTESAATSIDLLTGGNLSHDNQLRLRTGVGGNQSRRGGMNAHGGTATFYITPDTEALLAAGIRDAYPRGDLTELIIEGGADVWARLYTDAVISSFDIEFAREEGLAATVNWGALTAEAGTGSTVAALDDDIWEDYDIVIQGLAYAAAEEYGVNGLTVNVENQVSFHSNANTKTDSDRIRDPQFWLHGTEILTATLTCDEPVPQETVEIWKNDLDGNLQIALVGTNATHTVSVTLSNLMLSTDDHGFVGAETLAGWQYNFVGDAQNGSLAFDIDTI